MRLRSLLLPALLALATSACQRSRHSEVDDRGLKEERAQALDAGSETSAADETFVLKSSGVRCMAAPCPYFLATSPARPGAEPVQVHELAWERTGAPDTQISKWTIALEGGELNVTGQLKTHPKAGPAGDATVLDVARVNR